MMRLSKKHIAYSLVILFGVFAIIGFVKSGKVEQDVTYHCFSDDKTYLSITNFWNVISNLPFLIVGVLGIYKLNLFTKDKIQYLVFFIGVALVAVGSSYYHITPNNNTLIWDRLPMTISFMALLSIIISEFIDDRLGKRLFFVLLSLGLLSVVYWVVFKDLRFYFLIQFYPMAIIPVILLLFRSNSQITIGYWLLLLMYIIAKLLEHFDREIHDVLTIISGHSLKHIIAALGVFILYKSYRKILC